MTFLTQPLYSLLKCAAICVFALTMLPAQAQDAPKQETHGINPANMDTAVKPGDNFYLYCNGDWIKRTELPPDRARIGVFNESRRPERQAHRSLDRRGRQEQRSGRFQPAQDRRPLQLLYGRGGHRRQRPIAARAASQGHRRHQQQERACLRARRNPACRCRRAKQHQLPHRASCLDCGSLRASTTPSITPLI